jgi:hypothetical protein
MTVTQTTPVVLFQSKFGNPAAFLATNLTNLALQDVLKGDEEDDDYRGAIKGDKQDNDFKIVLKGDDDE